MCCCPHAGQDAPRRVSVVLIDDHPVVRDGLAFLLGAERDFEVVGEAADCATAWELIEHCRPQVAVLDLSLCGEEAIPLLGRLRESLPQIRVLVLSMHDEELYAERLLSLGAHGYIMKQEQPAEFLRALRQVAAGGHYLSERLQRRRLARAGRSGDASGAARLTGRECDVLRLVGQGLGTQEIARRLEMSAKTVDSHRRNIRDKLGLPSTRALVRYALRWADELAGSERQPA